MKLNWNRIKRAIASDGRKLFIMTSLLSVMLLLWGRLLLKDVPRSAVARPSAAVASATTPAVPLLEFSQPDNHKQVVAVPLYRHIQRDLFRFKPDHYPPAEGLAGNVADPAKSGTQEADVSGQQQRLAVMAAAQQLKLQSTMQGAHSRALINGLLLEPGQSISGFTLKEVRTRQVVLVKDGFEVVLEM